MLARNKGVRAAIYMTRLTAPAIDWGAAPPARLEAFQAGASFQIGDIEVQSFGIPHDAIDPVGYCFEAQGVRIGVATDLGYVPESIKFHLRRTNVLLLEANHDLDMLKVGPYPWSVKQRVMSRVGHLSNLHMSDYLMQDLDVLHGESDSGPPERAEQSPGDRADGGRRSLGAARTWKRGSRCHAT